MNCAMCMWKEAALMGGPFMFKGTSYCKRHLILAMNPSVKAKKKPPSDASKPKVKWKDDTVAK